MAASDPRMDQNPGKSQSANVRRVDDRQIETTGDDRHEHRESEKT
jgi:hypothetical protein